MSNESPVRKSTRGRPAFKERLVTVNDPAWKTLIEDEFGGGITSAIDFDMGIECQPHAKGRSLKMTMSGKFLPPNITARRSRDGITED